MRPRKPTTVLILLACLAFLLSCKKDGSAISIEGFYLLDNSGNYVGLHGEGDDDWIVKTTLSSREMALFDFPTANPGDITGTGEGTINGRVVAYPNPFTNIQAYHAESSLPVILRLVVVDNNLNILTKYVTRFQYSLDVQMSLDAKEFVAGGSYRVYFSFSAEGKPNFKVGFGDIKKCASGVTNPHDCF